MLYRFERFEITDLVLVKPGVFPEERGSFLWGPTKCLTDMKRRERSP